MRLVLTLLAAGLLLPLVAPVAGAQAADSPANQPQRLLEDKDLDVRVAVGGTDQDPSGRWASGDLLALDVSETPDEITFALTMKSLVSTPEVPFAENFEYEIRFRHADQLYRVWMQRFGFIGSSTFGVLEAFDPARQEFNPVGPYQNVAEELAAGTLTFTTDRNLLLDRQGNAPHPEVPLTDWQATTVAYPGFRLRVDDFCLTGDTCNTQQLPYAHDAMPDQGNGTLDFVTRHGIAQTGHARLYSEVPTRASNGEATTIVYQVQAVNNAPRNDTFALAVTGVPPGWQVRLPASRVTVIANGTLLMPILLSIPFAHQHGTYQKFVVEMRSQSDSASVGRIQLGVRYLNPPQPAGHHNALWLHVAPPSAFTGNPALDTPAFTGPGRLYMNAIDNDPLDTHADMPSSSCGTRVGPPPQALYCWYIPLKPQLELGLDFDSGRTGTVSIPLKTTLPLLGATLTGSLRYLAPDQYVDFSEDPSVVVANVVAHAPVDIQANSEAAFLSADIVATPDGDYVPYAKGASLYLQLQVAATGAQLFGGFLGRTTVPLLQSGGVLSDLPLNEYRDVVTQVFTSNSTLHLMADGPQDRATNPGKTLMFNLTLHNAGEAGTFNLELTGVHLPWARVVAPGEKIRLDADQSVPIRIAVQVPATADKGDTADLVLTVASASDLNVRGLARLYATVDTLKEYPDEAPLLAGVPAEKPLPAPGIPLLAFLALGLTWWLRRRT